MDIVNAVKMMQRGHRMVRAEHGTDVKYAIIGSLVYRDQESKPMILTVDDVLATDWELD